MMNNEELLDSVRAENENIPLSGEVKAKMLAVLAEFDRQRLELLNKGAEFEEAVKLAIVGTIIRLRL